MGKVVFDEGLEEFEFDFNNYGEATLSQQFSNLAAYWITWGTLKILMAGFLIELVWMLLRLAKKSQVFAVDQVKKITLTNECGRHPIC